MIAVTLGLLFGERVFGVAGPSADDAIVIGITEATLASLLFADATAIDVSRVRSFVSLPARLLILALPMTVILATLTNRMLLPDLSWAEAALIAAMLTPTDAALGQSVINNPAVPVRVRETLDIESGLNDGIVVPIFLTLLLIVAGEDVDNVGGLVVEAASSILLGVVAGVLLGAAAGRLFKKSVATGWSTPASLRLGGVGAVALAYLGADGIGGNSFIACFTAGLAIRAVAGEEALPWRSLTEDAGTLGATAVFVIFGAAFVGPALSHLSAPIIICALLTLTLARMAPTALALTGTKLQLQTVGFLGWFGPRGLASVLFGLLVVEETGRDVGTPFFTVVTVVVLASVYLHGLSAAPLATAYGRWYANHPSSDNMPEAEPTPSPSSRRHRS